MIGSLPHHCTIQRRYQKQNLTYASGTAMFHSGATVTGGVSGAKAVIDRIGGTTATGYLVLREIVGIFQSGELVTDDGTPAGSATTSAAPVNYQNDSGEAEYWWEDDQLNVRCRFYSMRAKVTVLTPGQFPDLQPFVILRPTATVNPIDYRIGSSMPGYTPASGQYQILSIKAPYNRTSLDHYELALKEIPSA